MIIKYSMDDKKYYMRDLGDGSGTFVRLDKALELKNGFIISFGYSHMAVNFFGDQIGPPANASHLGANYDKIQLKFIDGPKTDQSFVYSSEHKILIGRMPSCDIRFDDT